MDQATKDELTAFATLNELYKNDLQMAQFVFPAVRPKPGGGELHEPHLRLLHGYGVPLGAGQNDLWRGAVQRRDICLLSIASGFSAGIGGVESIKSVRGGGARLAGFSLLADRQRQKPVHAAVVLQDLAHLVYAVFALGVEGEKGGEELLVCHCAVACSAD